MEYTIIGDTKKYGPCLIYACGKKRETAERVLDRMLNNPNAADIIVMEGHTNIRINEIEEKQAWWNDPFLAN